MNHRLFANSFFSAAPYKAVTLAGAVFLSSYMNAPAAAQTGSGACMTDCNASCRDAWVACLGNINVICLSPDLRSGDTSNLCDRYKVLCLNEHNSCQRLTCPEKCASEEEPEEEDAEEEEADTPADPDQQEEMVFEEEDLPTAPNSVPLTVPGIDPGVSPNGGPGDNPDGGPGGNPPGGPDGGGPNGSPGGSPIGGPNGDMTPPPLPGGTDFPPLTPPFNPPLPGDGGGGGSPDDGWPRPPSIPGWLDPDDPGQHKFCGGDFSIKDIATCLYNDPHMRSFDGLAYGFQAVGEYHLARSGEMDIDVQVRLAPYGSRRNQSMISAMAARSGEARVSVDANRAHFLELNGEPTEIEIGLSNAINDPSGIYILRETEETYRIALPGDVVVSIQYWGGLYINVSVVGIRTDDEQLAGIAGVSDGDPSNDFTVRNGAALPVDGNLSYDQLYRQFGDSWRISQADSLFNYAEGESTATYTDLTFPDQHLTLADLDDDVRRHAEEVCRAQDVELGIAFDNCVYDVGFTGDDSFAEAYVGISLAGATPIVITNEGDGADTTHIVKDGSATLEAPATAGAGSTITVKWTGPANNRDYISLARPDQGGGKFMTYRDFVEGSDTVTITAPGIPGEYELRYIIDAEDRVLASIPLTVSAVTAELEAPATAGAGSTITVKWQGPANDHDYISLAHPGQAGGKYIAYKDLIDDSDSVTITVPGIPDEYELRYIIDEGGLVEDIVLASIPLTVIVASATLEAPDTVSAGSTITVKWTGPANKNDYITFARSDQLGGRYESLAYLVDGADTVSLKVPDELGTYELRYVLSSDAQIVTSVPIAVE